MPSAASRPSNTAVTTRSEPRTISPPANTFALAVWNLCLANTSPCTLTRPSSCSLMVCGSNHDAGLGRKPNATMTRSAGMICSEPGKIGRAHVLTPVTHAHLVCRLLLEQKNNHLHTPRPHDSTNPHL